MGNHHNVLVFSAAIKYWNENSIKRDYGYSVFKPIVVRIIPKSQFKDGIKPLIPWLTHLIKATKSENSIDGNPAVGQMEEYYLSGGHPLCFTLMAIFGFIISLIPNVGKGGVIQAITLSSTVLCYQIITRGYTAQHIELLVFLAFPFLVIYLSFKALKKVK